MIRRRLLVLVAPMCVASCLEETTSLGGPLTSESATTSEEAGTGRRTGTSKRTTEPASAPELDSSGGLECAGRGYTWAPEATGECEYLLPTSTHDGSSDPDYHPSTWNPSRVWAWAFPLSDPQRERQAGYVPSSDDCGTTAGWYYVQGDAQEPTHFALCPAFCSFVNSSEDMIFRLTSWKPDCD